MLDQPWVKLLSYAVTVLVTVVLSMTGFWMMIGREYVTRAETAVLIEQYATDPDEVLKLIEVSGPYNQDRALIMQTLNDNKEASKDLRTAIDNNTRALVKLEAILETLVTNQVNPQE